MSFFIGLCFGLNDNQIVEVINRIHEDISQTKYSCAIGYSSKDGKKSFEEMMEEADKLMYAAKRKMKTTEVR